MSITEATIQAVLMLWCMNDKHHVYMIPNSNTFLNSSWETDLISVTRAGLCHEYEIKLNIADYRRDAKKRKFIWGYLGEQKHAPAYFWYATSNFKIDPPETAGWLNIYYNPDRYRWEVDVKKEAPRLNSWKMTEQKQKDAARLLSWRLAHIYKNLYLMKKDQSNDN